MYSTLPMSRTLDRAVLVQSIFILPALHTTTSPVNVSILLRWRQVAAGMIRGASVTINGIFHIMIPAPIKVLHCLALLIDNLCKQKVSGVLYPHETQLLWPKESPGSGGPGAPCCCSCCFLVEKGILEKGIGLP